MNIVVYLLLLFAAAVLAYSVAATVKMFKCFVSSESKQAEESKQNLIKYRKKMIISYVIAVIFITAAAIIKLLFV
jgi:hypothetical protein